MQIIRNIIRKMSKLFKRKRYYRKRKAILKHSSAIPPEILDFAKEYAKRNSKYGS